MFSVLVPVSAEWFVHCRLWHLRFSTSCLPHLSSDNNRHTHNTTLHRWQDTAATSYLQQQHIQHNREKHTQSLTQRQQVFHVKRWQLNACSEHSGINSSQTLSSVHKPSFQRPSACSLRTREIPPAGCTCSRCSQSSSEHGTVPGRECKWKPQHRHTRFQQVSADCYLLASDATTAADNHCSQQPSRM